MTFAFTFGSLVDPFFKQSYPEKGGYGGFKPDSFSSVSCQQLLGNFRQSLNFQSPSISSWIFYFSSAFSVIRSLAYTLLFLCLWNSLHPVLRRSLHLFLRMILPFDSFTSYLLFKAPQHASFSFSFCVQAHMCWLMFHEIRRETLTFFAQFFTIVATTIVWTQFLLDKRWEASICHWIDLKCCRPSLLHSFACFYTGRLFRKQNRTSLITISRD